MSTMLHLPVERQAPSDAMMTQWVVYAHPSDYPDGYVLRAAFVFRNGDVWIDHVAWYSEDVDKLRELIPPGFVMLDRLPADDPAIHEVWI